jgi:hypothetical protein
MTAERLLLSCTSTEFCCLEGSVVLGKLGTLKSMACGGGEVVVEAVVGVVVGAGAELKTEAGVGVGRGFYLEFGKSWSRNRASCCVS